MSTINLAWCCDDSYAQHMGAAICSALFNLSKDTLANIFIVSGGMSDGVKHTINAIIEKYNAHVHFLDVDKEHFAGLKISHYISPAAYFRIALPDLLPGEISKILYLDCDLIVLDDLTKLYNIDISDVSLGAIAEGDQGCPDIPRQILGIPQDATYFNSGVLLLNLEKWRKEGIAGKLFDFIRENPQRIRYWDQDALNIFFYDTFKPIDYRWNFTIQHMKKAGTHAMQDIGILHFVGGHSCKPWYRECDHPLKAEYYTYLNMTPWRGTRPRKIKTGNKFFPWAIKMMRKTVSLSRELYWIYKNRKATLRRNLPQGKIIADCQMRYAFRRMLIQQGLAGKPEFEKLFGYRFYFFNYETFLILFNEIFLCNEYGFSAGSSKPFIIDCGSNIGMSVLYFKIHYPEARIFAFEPDDETFKLLEKNISCNNLYDIKACNCAVSDREGEMTLYYDPALAGSLLMSTSPRDGDAFTDEVQASLDKVGLPKTAKKIKGVLLSSYISQAVDLLKMDIEGSEHEVIAELAHSGKIGLVKKMVIEYHLNMKEDERGLSSFLAILEKNNFGYQINASHPNFNAGTGKFQNIIIFAYNRGSGACP